MQGLYQDKPELPFVVGKEAAGVVTAAGAGARAAGFKVGDAVVAVGDGAFAERMVAHRGACWRAPPGLDLKRAAALPIAYGTADVALRARANLREGQTLLVLGASGGVGTAAVQIGKLLGARVVAVTAGADKAAYLRSLGADAVVDTAAVAAAAVAAAAAASGGGGSGGGSSGGGAASKPGALPPGALRKALRAALPKGGADAVFDPVGGAFALEALRAVAWGGQYLAIGFVAGIPKVPANLLLLNNVTLHGVYWGSYMQRAPRVLRESMDQLLAWAAAGRLAVPLSGVLPLERAPEAMAALLRRRVTGKIVLLPAAGAEDAEAEAGQAGRSRL